MISIDDVQNITRRVAGETPDNILSMGYSRLLEPKHDDVVYYKDKDNDVFTKVRIVYGCYFDPKYGRVSNFWWWVSIDEMGNEAAETSHGYGDFYLATVNI